MSVRAAFTDSRIVSITPSPDVRAAPRPGGRSLAGSVAGSHPDTVNLRKARGRGVAHRARTGAGETAVDGPSGVLPSHAPPAGGAAVQPRRIRRCTAAPRALAPGRAATRRR